MCVSSSGFAEKKLHRLDLPPTRPVDTDQPRRDLKTRGDIYKPFREHGRHTVTEPVAYKAEAIANALSWH